MVAVRATFLLGEVERPHTTIRNRVVEASRCSIVRDARIEKKNRERSRRRGGPAVCAQFQSRISRTNVRVSNVPRCCSRIPRGSSWNFSHVTRLKIRLSPSGVFQNWLSRYDPVEEHGDTSRGEFRIARSGLRK